MRAQDFPCPRDKAMCVLVPSEALKALGTKRITQMETYHATEPNVADRRGKSVSPSSVSVAEPTANKAGAAGGKSDAKPRARAPRSARRRIRGGKQDLPRSLVP